MPDIGKVTDTCYTQIEFRDKRKELSSYAKTWINLYCILLGGKKPV